MYSYAPTYTLFSDNAKKQRYVRVPVGKQIVYNPATGDFDIPTGTRFYKTFLRGVTDEQGVMRYRKIETRLIVSRPNEVMPDGKVIPRALRATYAWSRDERVATRVRDPLRNGDGWRDRVCPVIVDRGKLGISS